MPADDHAADARSTQPPGPASPTGAGGGGQLRQVQAGYAERLTVPVGWWLLGALFAVSMLAAVLFYLGPAAGAATGVLTMAVIAAMFLGYGRTRIAVDPDRLWVGRANIEWSYVGGVRALDQAATRERRGPSADARAYLVLRPYLRESVEVIVDDRSDPTPYWLVSTRHPARLTAAIRHRIDRGPDLSASRDTLKS